MSCNFTITTVSSGNYNVLCIAGGGMKGVPMLGALHYLYFDVNALEKIDTYVGTSIGAVICLLINIGYAPMQIFSKVLKIDDFLDIDLLNFLNFKKAYGLIDINQFVSLVEKAVVEKLGKVPTMKELYDQTKKRLEIVVTNYTKDDTEYFNWENKGEESCIDAIKKSCALPIIFDRIEENENIYVDGGIADNFAIEHATKFGNVIGIRTKDASGTPSDDIFSYVHRLFSIPVHKIEKLQYRIIELENKIKHYEAILKGEKNMDSSPVSNNLIICIDTDTKALEFTKDSNRKMSMFCQGYDCAKRDYKQF